MNGGITAAANRTVVSDNITVAGVIPMVTVVPEPRTHALLGIGFLLGVMTGQQPKQRFSISATMQGHKPGAISLQVNTAGKATQ